MLIINLKKIKKYQINKEIMNLMNEKTLYYSNNKYYYNFRF